MHDHTLFVWYSGVRLQVKEEYKMLLEKKKITILLATKYAQKHTRQLQQYP